MLKKILVFKIILISALYLSSCSSSLKHEQRIGKIYEQNQVTHNAEFEGGKKQLIQFLSSYLNYPPGAVMNNIQGKVVVKFIVEDNGTIGNFVILKDIGAGCANELIRGLEKTQGRWNAAKINKKRVRSNYILSVNFKIPKDHSQPYIQEDNF